MQDLRVPSEEVINIREMHHLNDHDLLLVIATKVQNLEDYVKKNNNIRPRLLRIETIAWLAFLISISLIGVESAFS